MLFSCWMDLEKQFHWIRNGKTCNSLGFGGQLVSYGLIVYWSLISSLIKEVAFSTAVFYFSCDEDAPLCSFFIFLIRKNPSKDLVTLFQVDTVNLIVAFFRDCPALHIMSFVFIWSVFDPSFPDPILIDLADIFQCSVVWFAPVMSNTYAS